MEASLLALAKSIYYSCHRDYSGHVTSIPSFPRILKLVTLKVKKISFLARRFIYSGSIRSGFQADFASLSSK